jgi:hypothetical protein
LRISSAIRARASVDVAIVAGCGIRDSGFDFGRAPLVLVLEVLQDLFDAVLVLDRLVEPELDLGHAAQAQPGADLAAEKRRGAIERARRLLPRLLSPRDV